MNQMRYFILHILTLSTSSRFWWGQKTGFEDTMYIGIELEYLLLTVCQNVSLDSILYNQAKHALLGRI